MKLIIDIPEKAYKLRLTNPVWYDSNMDKAIRNGKPLPKGHGDLIDSNVLCEQYEKTNGDLYQALDLTPIIIEADKGE